MVLENGSPKLTEHRLNSEAAELGTYAGRNPRAKGFTEGELCNLAGSYIPFAVTKKEPGEPRPEAFHRRAV